MKKQVLTLMSFVLILCCRTSAAAQTHQEHIRARPLDLSSVRLLSGPLKRAQDLDARYLLELEPDRMLACYRQRAGLEPKAKPYGGWDGGRRNLTGHIAGHYLSAVSLMWGPLVLAGDLGPEQRRRRGSRTSYAQQRAPVFVAAGRPVAEWLKPIADKPGHFRTAGVGRDRDVDFVPFYSLHRRMYAVYWDLFTEPEWQQKAAEYAAEEARLRKLEAATVAYVQPGQMQPERDFNYQSPGDAWAVRMVYGDAER